LRKLPLRSISSFKDTTIRDLINACHIDLLPRVHLVAECSAGWLHNPSKPVRRPKRLQILQSMPWIKSDVVLPGCLPRRNKRFLLRNDNFCHRLTRVLLGIPFFSSVLKGLVLKILEKLDLKEVLRLVLGIKVLQPITQNGVWMEI
jgi:hypothetical protein